MFNIIGQETSLNMLNKIDIGIKALQPRTTETDMIFPLLNDQFMLFNISKNYSDFFSSLPPLISPFTDLSFSSLTDILLYQKIGSTISDKPLLVFTDIGSQKGAFLF